MTNLEQLNRENTLLRQSLDAQRRQAADYADYARRLEAVNADLRSQIDHLLDQPLLVLSGDAFVSSRRIGPFCPN